MTIVAGTVTLGSGRLAIADAVAVARDHADLVAALTLVEAGTVEVAAESAVGALA